MTGRVCPIHGEYSASGICRWCEPLPPPDASPLPWVERQILVDWPVKADVYGESPVAGALRDVKALTEYDWTRGPEVDMLEALEAPLYAEVPPPGELTAAMVGLLASLPPAPHKWILQRTEAYIDAETTVAEQSRLASQHAALRWERVARRWNYKHRGAGGLDERERRYVWMHWLDQTARRCP